MSEFLRFKFSTQTLIELFKYCGVRVKIQTLQMFHIKIFRNIQDAPSLISKDFCIDTVRQIITKYTIKCENIFLNVEAL